MDISKIPKDILKVLTDKQLSIPQKMMAFNLLMPGLDPEPKHAQAYLDNLEVGNTIKRMIEEGKLSIHGFDSNFRLRTSEGWTYL